MHFSYMYLKKSLIILIHNNTRKTINSTAKASIVIVIVYHLKISDVERRGTIFKTWRNFLGQVSGREVTLFFLGRRRWFLIHAAFSLKWYIWFLAHGFHTSRQRFHLLRLLHDHQVILKSHFLLDIPFKQGGECLFRDAKALAFCGWRQIARIIYMWPHLVVQHYCVVVGVYYFHPWLQHGLKRCLATTLVIVLTNF